MGEQWIHLSCTFSAAEGSGEVEVRVDVTLVDGAMPPTRSGTDTDGPPRMHISIRLDVSKAARPGVVLTFMCSAWSDKMEVERVFPCSQQQYAGRQFR
jgi:complement component 1 Q subcomponent-binding protein, mitochondrial